MAAAFLTAATALIFVNTVFAQTTAAPAVSASQGPFTLLSPGELSLTVLGGGYISSDYGVTEQGVQVVQSITREIGLIGRATGYQLYIGDNFGNPLNPGRPHHSRSTSAGFKEGSIFI